MYSCSLDLAHQAPASGFPSYRALFLPEPTELWEALRQWGRGWAVRRCTRAGKLQPVPRLLPLLLLSAPILPCLHPSNLHQSSDVNAVSCWSGAASRLGCVVGGTGAGKNGSSLEEVSSSPAPKEQLSSWKVHSFPSLETWEREKQWWYGYSSQICGFIGSTGKSLPLQSLWKPSACTGLAPGCSNPHFEKGCHPLVKISV